MKLLASIAALFALALWLTAAPAVARSAAADDTVSADKKHKHKHRDGGSEQGEESEEELQWH